MSIHIKSSWEKFELYCLTSLLLFMAAVPECEAQQKPTAPADHDTIIAAAHEIISMQKY